MLFFFFGGGGELIISLKNVPRGELGTHLSEATIPLKNDDYFLKK